MPPISVMKNMSNCTNMANEPKELARKMYRYFISYTDVGAPSFSKFARSVGMTYAELMNLGENEEIKRACEECSEIRRDYLIDMALAKKQDASMTKFILTSEFGMGEHERSDGDGRLDLRLEVIG